MNIQNLSTSYTVRRLTKADAKYILNLESNNIIFYKYCPSSPTINSVFEGMQALPAN